MKENDLPRCATCAHWEKEGNYTRNRCSDFQNWGAEFNVFTDSTGWISSVETDENFSCINHTALER